MDPLFLQTIKEMGRAFQRLERQISPPELVTIGGNAVFRYSIQSIEQAIVQKLARLLSGLQAASCLLENGFVQEQGAIQRTLDEFCEDINFLAISRTNNILTELHQQFLNDFYMEEFDQTTSSPTSYPKRPMVKREKIRAYINRVLKPDNDPHTANAVATKISKAYSGYVHGASPHIMDMYGGNPPRFHTAGMLGTPRIREHHEDLWNYFYRGQLAFLIAAKAFGDKVLVNSLYAYLDQFEQNSKTTFRKSCKP